MRPVHLQALEGEGKLREAVKHLASLLRIAPQHLEARKMLPELRARIAAEKDLFRGQLPSINNAVEAHPGSFEWESYLWRRIEKRACMAS